MILRAALLAALVCWLAQAPTGGAAQRLEAANPTFGLSDVARAQLQRDMPQWLNASVACNDVRGFNSPTLNMLRAHFLESAAHFLSIDVGALTQKLGTDNLVSKMVCMKQAIMREGFGGTSGVPRYKIDDNATNFLLGNIGQRWHSRDLLALGKRSPLLGSVSRVEAASGDFFIPNGRPYRFKVVKHHYDFMCTSSLSPNCAPVDQVHCSVPSLKSDDRAHFLGSNVSTGACWVRQQPVYLSNKTEGIAKLQLPLLSMSFAYLNDSDGQRYSLQPPGVALPAMTTGTIPGINDANYTAFVPVQASTVAERRGNVGVLKSASWRAVPSEVLEKQFCAYNGTSIKTYATPDQSINGGFPFVVQNSSGPFCLLQFNYDQVQTVRNDVGRLGVTGTGIRGIGRTFGTGSCEPGQQPIVRGNPNWAGTIPYYNVLTNANEDLIKNDLCVADLPLYGPTRPQFGNCALSYCAPLYLPNFAGSTVRVETLDGAENYRRYGDAAWPRNQFVARNASGTETIPPDGILCDTTISSATKMLDCLRFCSSVGRPVGIAPSTQITLSRDIGLAASSSDCIDAVGISVTCSALLKNYDFALLQFGIEMPGDLSQTGANTELSQDITLATSNTVIRRNSTVNSYIGQTTLLESASMGSDLAPFGCAMDVGTYADGLEAQDAQPVVNGNKQVGVVQAILNATTSVDLLGDDNFKVLAAKARTQAFLDGEELTAVGVATAIASSVASLAGMLGILSKRKYRQYAFPVRGTTVMGFPIGPKWTAVSCGSLLGVLGVLCAVGLLPVALALRQEYGAVTASAVTSNIISGTRDLGTYDTRMENVYMTTVTVYNNPSNGKLYLAALGITGVLWIVIAVVAIAYNLTKARRYQRLALTQDFDQPEGGLDGAGAFQSRQDSAASSDITPNGTTCKECRDAAYV
mmetsp:Transcript_14262/g.43083  ORF Transcript_14262/g.43083 Transcript_14262/m.43083 type:complete len:921 (-) Transcript_14262:575-3337(-)